MVNKIIKNPKKSSPTKKQTLKNDSFFAKLTLAHKSSIIFVLLFLCLPIFYCAVIGFIKGYMFEARWIELIGLKSLEVTEKGLCDFGQEVTKFLMSLIFGYWLFYDGGFSKIKEIGLRYLLIIPFLFIFLVGVDKVSSKAVTHIKANYIDFQSNNTPGESDTGVGYSIQPHKPKT